MRPCLFHRQLELTRLVAEKRCPLGGAFSGVLRGRMIAAHVDVAGSKTCECKDAIHDDD